MRSKVALHTTSGFASTWARQTIFSSGSLTIIGYWGDRLADEISFGFCNSFTNLHPGVVGHSNKYPSCAKPRPLPATRLNTSFMIRLLFSIITISLLSSINMYGQRTELYNPKDEFYNKTNFTVIDTLDKWAFNIDTSYKGRPSDSVKPIGAITFIRTTQLFDKKYYKANNKLWRPYFSFEIFLLSDSVFCVNDSKNTRMLSSCLPPFTGGDVLFIGNLILLNRRVCNAFSIKWDTDTDFARPVINKVFSISNLSNIHTFQDFIDELPIKGKLL